MTSDHLQAIFWSLTYIFLIIHSLRYKNHGIPLTAMLANFAWETVALFNSLQTKEFSVSLLIHLAWFTLDLVMVILFFVYETKILENTRKKVYFLSAYVICTVCFVFLFDSGYMLQSSFVIDLTMAICFLLHVLLEYPNRNPLIYLVGLFKFLGDLMAWYYYRDNAIVNRIGLIVFICNLIYLLILICLKNPLILPPAKSCVKK